MKELIKIIDTLCDTVNRISDGCSDCPYFNPDKVNSSDDSECKLWTTLDEYERR